MDGNTFAALCITMLGIVALAAIDAGVATKMLEVLKEVLQYLVKHLPGHIRNGEDASEAGD